MPSAIRTDVHFWKSLLTDSNFIMWILEAGFGIPVLPISAYSNQRFSAGGQFSAKKSCSPERTAGLFSPSISKALFKLHRLNSGHIWVHQALVKWLVRRSSEVNIKAFQGRKVSVLFLSSEHEVEWLLWEQNGRGLEDCYRPCGFWAAWEVELMGGCV